MNIIVHTTGADASSLNGKNESPNKTLVNSAGDLLLNSIHKKELLCFSYKYDIWLSRQNENILRGDAPEFLCHGIIPSYKHIKIRGVKVYIINGRVTRKNLDDKQHRGYFIEYAATT